MANFPRVFPAGAPQDGVLPSAAVELLDVATSKSVNGDEGSTHTGHVTLGGLTTPQLRRPVSAVTLTGQSSVALDCDQSGVFLCALSTNTTVTTTLAFTNVRSGAEYLVEVRPESYTHPAAPVAFGGAGITHTLPSNWEPTPGPLKGLVRMRGVATSDTTIQWTVDQNTSAPAVNGHRLVERRLETMARRYDANGIPAYPGAKARMAWPFVLEATADFSSDRTGLWVTYLFDLPEQEWLFEYAFLVLDSNWTNTSGSNKRTLIYLEAEESDSTFVVVAANHIDAAWFSGSTYARAQKIVTGTIENDHAPLVDERTFFVDGPTDLSGGSWVKGPNGLATFDTVAPSKYRSAPGAPRRVRVLVNPADVAATWSGKVRAYVVGRLLG